MRRVLTPELMDQPGVGRGELGRALGFIRLVNRRLGGAAALIGLLRRWSVRWPKDQPVTLLDVATGSADIPVAAVQWARGAGFDLRVTAVDLHETTLDLAREHVASFPDVAGAIELRKADALRLPEMFAAGEGGFHYAHAGMFLHHLPEGDVTRVLTILDQLTSHGIVWNDLMRTRWAYAWIHVLTLGLPGIEKHDARVSVHAGFSRREVEQHARAAGIGYAKYRANCVYQRFTLAGEKPGAWS